MARANINARDHQGRTVLHYTLHLLPFRAFKQMVELLINVGVDLNLHYNMEGNMPLHASDATASINLQHQQYIINLMKMKLRLSTLFTNDMHVQWHAIQFISMPKRIEEEGIDKLIQIVKLLLKNSIDMTRKNCKGDIPLQCTIKVSTWDTGTVENCFRPSASLTVDLWDCETRFMEACGQWE